MDIKGEVRLEPNQHCNYCKLYTGSMKERTSTKQTIVDGIQSRLRRQNIKLFSLTRPGRANCYNKVTYYKQLIFSLCCSSSWLCNWNLEHVDLIPFCEGIYISIMMKVWQSLLTLNRERACIYAHTVLYSTVLHCTVLYSTVQSLTFPQIPCVRLFDNFMVLGLV